MSPPIDAKTVLERLGINAELLLAMGRTGMALDLGRAIVALRQQTERVEAAEYLRPEVRAFARLMEDALRKHDNRDGWKEASRSWLLSRLRQELDELSRTGLDDAKGNGREAADVANFAMMIADVSGGLAALAAGKEKP